MWLCFLSALAVAGEVRFAPEDGHAYTPVFSDDGKWLAFEVNRYGGGTIDLYVAAVARNGIAKDGVQVKLPGAGDPAFASGQVVMNPSWHPQGLVLAEGSNQGGLYRLYLYSPGGASATELLDTTRAPGNLTFPHVSADGNRVAYVTSDTGRGDLMSWDRVTNAFTGHTSTPSSEAFPAWRRDAEVLAFARRTNNTDDLLVIDAETGRETVIADGPGDQTRPAWVADDLVYFSSERGFERWDIVHHSKDGVRTTLARDVRLPLRTRPAVSKDGRWVAWVSADPVKADDIVWLTSIDGATTIAVHTGFEGCGEPALAEQNGRALLAFTYLPEAGSDFRRLHVLDITEEIAGAGDPELLPEDRTVEEGRRMHTSAGPDAGEVGRTYLKRVASAAILAGALALTLYLRSRRRA